MIVKDLSSDKFYNFDSENFSFIKCEKSKNYSGDLFIIGSNKYVLFKDNGNSILQSNSFLLNIKDFSFEYKESKIFSYLIIENNNIKYKIKKIKSIWEYLKISTYDLLEKIEDNKLFFLFDRIKDLKTNNG